MNGGVSSKQMHAAGQKTIMLARRALEIHTQRFGPESEQVSEAMSLLADALSSFNDVDDDEILRL